MVDKLLILLSILNEASETLLLIFPQIKCSKNIKSKILKINSIVGVKKLFRYWNKKIPIKINKKSEFQQQITKIFSPAAG